jgi:hypothetical protein
LPLPSPPSSHTHPHTPLVYFTLDSPLTHHNALSPPRALTHCLSPLLPSPPTRLGSTRLDSLRPEGLEARRTRRFHIAIRELAQRHHRSRRPARGEASRGEPRQAASISDQFGTPSRKKLLRISGPLSLP